MNIFKISATGKKKRVKSSGMISLFHLIKPIKTEADYRLALKTGGNL
jgi:hypothetical protein